MVVPEGIEPSSSVCKTEVMPIIPRDYIFSRALFLVKRYFFDVILR